MRLLTLLCLFIPMFYGCATTPNDQISGANYSTVMRIAQAAQQSNNPALAIRAYKIAQQQRPNALSPTLALGQLYQQTLQYDQAIKLYQQALIQQQDSVLYRELGIAFLKIKDYHNAISQFFNGLSKARSKENLYTLYNDIGVLLDKLGLHLYAQACYRQGLRYAPNNQGLHYNLQLSLRASSTATKNELSDLELNKINKLCAYHFQLTTPRLPKPNFT